MNKKEFDKFQKENLLHIENIPPFEAFIADLLKTNFSGMDYWHLSKRWKQLKFEEVARLILKSYDDWNKFQEF